MEKFTTKDEEAIKEYIVEYADQALSDRYKNPAVLLSAGKNAYKALAKVFNCEDKLDNSFNESNDPEIRFQYGRYTIILRYFPPADEDDGLVFLVALQCDELYDAIIITDK